MRRQPVSPVALNPGRIDPSYPWHEAVWATEEVWAYRKDEYLFFLPPIEPHLQPDASQIHYLNTKFPVYLSVCLLMPADIRALKVCSIL
jgi:hypothetical protein